MLALGASSALGLLLLLLLLPFSGPLAGALHRRDVLLLYGGDCRRAAGQVVDVVGCPQRVVEVAAAQPHVGHRRLDNRRELVTPHAAYDVLSTAILQIRVSRA